ncbi:hypothetical protein KHS38_02045 [Mucilaginibacter sp. Bleaf8]|uniref:DUF6580 family putative transport protein n=1 Tax=Mucilaginibacter sp. Bleaf8 TaxID=2834430 RepID=UPI001BCC6CBA|nr:DUF6580 family putative transport protein [Mucilaginibacter sp. Bleaf8]MBS7563175.1 hypothetical protein [Mucilaginibacter sp. Bleaf8]
MSSLKKINLSIPAWLLAVVAAVISTAAMRYVSYTYPALSNLTPMGALAIFGGAYFADKWKAGLLPVITLFVTDIFINYLYFSKLVWFNTYSLWLYASLIIMVFIGGMIKNVNVTSVLMASLASVVVHWLLTDISPWLNSNLYDKGIIGYGESLIMALPFERNMLLADAIFGAILFGGYAWLHSRSAVKASEPVSA